MNHTEEGPDPLAGFLGPRLTGLPKEVRGIFGGRMGPHDAVKAVLGDPGDPNVVYRTGWQGSLPAN